MDSTVSATAAARQLGTSVPRVVRAARRLGLDDRSGRGRLHLSPSQVARLREYLGETRRIPGMPPVEVAALAALARSPLGLSSARAVARKASISPTAASTALKRLLAEGLVREESELIIAGRPRQVRMLYANHKHPRYAELAPRLEQVRAPHRAPDERVPPRLSHLFWNTEPSQLDVEHGGPYIARRLLRTLDPAGLAWGARNLRARDWREAGHARGLDPAVRALAENLAAESER